MKRVGSTPDGALVSLLEAIVLVILIVVWLPLDESITTVAY